MVNQTPIVQLGCKVRTESLPSFEVQSPHSRWRRPEPQRAALKMAAHAPGAGSGSGCSGAGRDTPSAPGAAMADGPVADVLLRRLEAADGGLDSAELAAELGVEHQAVVGAVKSLQALGEVSRPAFVPGGLYVRPAQGARARSRERVRARVHGPSSCSKRPRRHDRLWGGDTMVRKEDVVAALTGVAV